MIADGDEYTPTPAVSHAILTCNRGRKTGLADGIVITPSHNPRTQHGRGNHATMEYCRGDSLDHGIGPGAGKQR